ncbi:MAG: hypothetical protein IJV44_09760 [Prevotella sp.]|nr:hypothetical protein [Prevotella sp.]
MRKRWKIMENRVVMQLLTWLGIGSTSLIFMACYGPAPRNYQVVEDEDSTVVMIGDSVVMSVDNASAEDVAVTDEQPEAE